MCLKMDLSVHIILFLGVFLVSSASESPDLTNNALEGDMREKSVNFPQPFLEERVEKKEHKFFILEEEDDEITSLRVSPNLEPVEGDERLHYTHVNEEGQLDEDQPAANGTLTEEPKLVHTKTHYVIPIIMCLGLVLAGLMLFTYYFKWTEKGVYRITDYNFFFFKIKVTEVPPIPDA